MDTCQTLSAMGDAEEAGPAPASPGPPGLGQPYSGDEPGWLVRNIPPSLGLGPGGLEGLAEEGAEGGQAGARRATASWPWEGGSLLASAGSRGA